MILRRLFSLDLLSLGLVTGLCLGLGACAEDVTDAVSGAGSGGGGLDSEGDGGGLGDGSLGGGGGGARRGDAGRGGGDAGGDPNNESGFLGSDSNTTPSIPFLTAMENSALHTAYRGDRLVRQLTIQDSIPVTLEFRETVTSDGDGMFKVNTEHLSGAHDIDLFEAVQDGRQKFSLTQRDFQVTDARLLIANYVIHVAGQRDVAGFPCVEIRAQRQVNPTSRHRVFVEPDSGLILAWYETKLTGEHILSFVYETIEFDPDLAGTWFGSSNFSTAPLTIDTSGNAPSLGFELHQPTLPPTGHRLLQSQTLLDPLGREWAKLFYTDGATITVWMHRAAGTGDGTDGLSWTTFGGNAAVIGEVQGVPLVTVGRVSKDMLLSVVHSAF